MCDWLLSPGHTFATVLEATRGINHYLEWRTMNETEMDESLEDLDLEGPIQAARESASGGPQAEAAEESAVSHARVYHSGAPGVDGAARWKVRHLRGGVPREGPHDR
jgi:hypothetical protein